VAEDHQTKNAMSLVSKGAAVFVSDSDAETKLVDEALQLIRNSDLQKKLSDNIGELALPDADEVIAREVMKLAS